MHWIIDALFLLVGATMVFEGVRRGFFKAIFDYLKFVLAIATAYLLGGQVAALLHGRFIATPVRDFVHARFSAFYATSSGAAAEEALEALPSFLVTEEVRANVLAAAGAGGTELVDTITASVAPTISQVIANITGYLLTFVLALIGFAIAAYFLGKLTDSLRFLDRINRLLGGALGLISALTFLLSAASVLRFFFAEDPIYADSIVVKLFGESPLLKTFRFLDVGEAWLSKLIRN